MINHVFKLLILSDSFSVSNDCNTHVEPFFIVLTDGYDINNIAYKWELSTDDGMSFVPSDMKMLPQFKLTTLQLSTLCTTYVVG